MMKTQLFSSEPMRIAKYIEYNLEQNGYVPLWIVITSEPHSIERCAFGVMLRDTWPISTWKISKIGEAWRCAHYNVVRLKYHPSTKTAVFIKYDFPHKFAYIRKNIFVYSFWQFCSDTPKEQIYAIKKRVTLISFFSEDQKVAKTATNWPKFVFFNLLDQKKCLFWLCEWLSWVHTMPLDNIQQ